MIRTFTGRTLAGRTFAGRAWTEVDLSALRHNARALAGLAPQGVRIMAVVKADAYGHGDVRVAQTLYRCGVRDFAVATLEEGIRLRRHMARGRILVLGYTDPREAAALWRWRLAQTAVDAAHAQALDAQKNGCTYTWPWTPECTGWGRTRWTARPSTRSAASNGCEWTACSPTCASPMS